MTDDLIKRLRIPIPHPPVVAAGIQNEYDDWAGKINRERKEAADALEANVRDSKRLELDIVAYKQKVESQQAEIERLNKELGRDLAIINYSELG